jgi:hypothetical protein
MQPKFRPFLSISSYVVAIILVAAVFNTTARAQFSNPSGGFLYALNQSQVDVFDVSPDGKIGIVLRNDPVAAHPAIITTFDPVLGTQFDSKTFGFGPLGVRLTKVGNNLRAVVLTSEGGPRRIYLFDVSNTGQLTQITSTQLTTSNADGGSNLVLSGSGAVGFAAVFASTNSEIVSFSLSDGSIIKRVPVAAAPPSHLTLFEGTNKRLLAYRQGATLKVLDVLDPAQPQEVASVALVTNNEFSGNFNDSIGFSSDGQFVFFANQFFNFAAINLNTGQIVGTIPGNFRFLRLEVFDSGQQRKLAVLSGPGATGGISALLLVDATNPSQLAVVKTVTPTDTAYFKFAHDGSRLYAAEGSQLVAYDLPAFTTVWTQHVPGQLTTAHQVSVYGSNDEILGAWSDGGTAILGTFPAFPPNVSVTGALSVDESAGVANVTVSLSAPSNHRVNINYSTLSDTAETGIDYSAVSGILTLQPGATSGVIAIPINDDTSDEFDETFKLNITASPGIVTGNQTTITILDNDPPPSVSISDGNGFEGNVATNNSFVTISLSAASARTVTVDYTTAANTASESDFVPTTGTITFSPGQTALLVVIPIVGDRLSESDETFFINLSNPTNATLNDAQAVVTIVDNDAPVLAIDTTSQRAIALDALMFTREPFVVNNPNYFGSDKRTRVMLFTLNLVVTPGLVVTAQAVDSQQTVYQLPVEFVGNVPNFTSVVPQEPFLTQIVLRLPDGIVNAGDLLVSITTRDKTSNKVPIAVTP